MNRIHWFVYIACLLGTTASASAEAIIREEQESPGARIPDADDKVEVRYDRFHHAKPTSSQFRWKHIDWSGVGKGVGVPQWGTLVAPQFFVTARHARPAPGKRLRFYSGDNPRVPASPKNRDGFRDGDVGQNWTISHENGSHENGKATDLTLGALKKPMDVSYYPIFVRPTIVSAGGNPRSAYGSFGDEMVMFGQAGVSTVEAYFDPACTHSGNNSTSQGYTIPFWFGSKDFVRVRVDGKGFKDFRVQGAKHPKGGKLFTNVPVRGKLEIGQIYEDGSVLSNATPAAQKVGTNRAAKGYVQPDLIYFFYDEPNNPAEFMPRRSTSGAPSLFLVDERPTVAGVHSGVLDFSLCHYRMDQPLPNTETTPDGMYQRGPRMYDVALGYFRRQMQQRMEAVQARVPKHQRQVLICYTMDPKGNVILGDYNGDFSVDQADVDIMVREVRMRRRNRSVRGYNWYLDWNSDRKIDQRDERHFFAKVVRKPKGDFDLNGRLDENDADIIARNLGRDASDYAHGDFDGNGTTDRTDKYLWDHAVKEFLADTPRVTEGIASK